MELIGAQHFGFKDLHSMDLLTGAVLEFQNTHTSAIQTHKSSLYPLVFRLFFFLAHRELSCSVTVT